MSPSVETTTSSPPLSETQRAVVRTLLDELSITGRTLLERYGLLLYDTPALQLRVARIGEATGLNTVAALPLEFIHDQPERLNAFLDKCEERFAGPLIVGLGTRVLDTWREYVGYLRALEDQGGSTTTSMFLASPLRWLPRDQDVLLTLRLHFGVQAKSIFSALERLYPEGCPETLKDVIAGDNAWVAGLVVKNGEGALACAEKNRETLSALRDLCVSNGRLDAFLAATTHLSDSLLTNHSEKLLELAAIRPDKLPDIVKHITEDTLVRFGAILPTMCRSASNRIAAAVQSLQLVTDQEIPLAYELMRTSGVFSAKALELRGSALFQSDPARHLALLETYGPAYWGLAQRFRDKLHANVELHRDFINEALVHTGLGAGDFFAHLPEDLWNDQGIALARRYGAASGYVLPLISQLKREPILETDFRSLVDFNQEMFGIKWLNRFVKISKGSLDAALLEMNRTNCQAVNDGRATALYIGAATDPLNSLASPTSFRLLSTMAQRLRMFVSEANSKHRPLELMRAICEDQRYGAAPDSSRLIDVLILASHSNGYTLQWDGYRHAPRPQSQGAAGHADDFSTPEDVEFFASWAKYLAPNARVILHACSTFKDPGASPSIGHAIKRTLHKTRPDIQVFGLTKPGDINDFELDARGLPTRIYWRDGYCWY